MKLTKNICLTILVALFFANVLYSFGLCAENKLRTPFLFSSEEILLEEIPFAFGDVKKGLDEMKRISQLESAIRKYDLPGDLVRKIANTKNFLIEFKDFILYVKNADLRYY